MVALRCRKAARNSCVYSNSFLAPMQMDYGLTTEAFMFYELVIRVKQSNRDINYISHYVSFFSSHMELAYLRTLL